MAPALAEKLEQTGTAEKESLSLVPRSELLERIDNQIVRWERVTVSERCTLPKKRGIRAGAWRGKSQFHSKGRWVPRRGGSASKEN